MSTTTATAIRYYEEEKRRYSYWIEHPQGTNYIGVLPGNFSFFPTVAYQGAAPARRDDAPPGLSLRPHV
jgi:hypothetical protein